VSNQLAMSASLQRLCFFTLPMKACPPAFICTCSTRTNCCPPPRSRRRTSTCIANVFIKRAAADASAAIRRSVPKAASSLARTAMEPECVQAIWTASAPSISSFGPTASIIASGGVIGPGACVFCTGVPLRLCRDERRLLPAAVGPLCPAPDCPLRPLD
jgi:hypothetical protein